MSYILDALKKTEADRARNSVPTLKPRDLPDDLPTKKKKWPFIIVGALALNAVLLVVLFFGKTEDPMLATATPAPQQPSAQAQAQAQAQTQEQAQEQEQEQVQAPQETPPPQVATAPSRPTTPKPEIEISETLHAADLGVAPQPKATRQPTNTPTPASPAPVRPSLPALGSATDYLERAWAQLDDGLYNQAIADFSAAINMEPGYVDAWFGRGWAQEKKGAAQNARDDYSQAIALRPDHVNSFFSRGILHLYLDAPAKAADDFSSVVSLGDESLKRFALLWLYVAEARSGKDGRVELGHYAGRMNLSPWPGALIRYFLGTANEREVLSDVGNANPTTRSERECVGFYFLGMHALLRGETETAKAYFRRTLETGVTRFRQYDAAKIELNRLEKR